jgi:hypothetical protein
VDADEVPQVALDGVAALDGREPVAVRDLAGDRVELRGHDVPPVRYGTLILPTKPTARYGTRANIA